eukprot:gene11176-12461_t
MPKNRLQELDEILAKSQRLSSHVSDGGSAARQLNYRVSELSELTRQLAESSRMNASLAGQTTSTTTTTTGSLRLATEAKRVLDEVSHVVLRGGGEASLVRESVNMEHLLAGQQDSLCLASLHAAQTVAAHQRHDALSRWLETDFAEGQGDIHHSLAPSLPPPPPALLLSSRSHPPTASASAILWPTAQTPLSSPLLQRHAEVVRSLIEASHSGVSAGTPCRDLVDFLRSSEDEVFARELSVVDRAGYSALLDLLSHMVSEGEMDGSLPGSFALVCFAQSSRSLLSLQSRLTLGSLQYLQSLSSSLVTARGDGEAVGPRRAGETFRQCLQSHLTGLVRQGRLSGDQLTFYTYSYYYIRCGQLTACLEELESGSPTVSRTVDRDVREALIVVLRVLNASHSFSRQSYSSPASLGGGGSGSVDTSLGPSLALLRRVHDVETQRYLAGAPVDRFLLLFLGLLTGKATKDQLSGCGLSVFTLEDFAWGYLFSGLASYLLGSASSSSDLQASSGPSGHLALYDAISSYGGASYFANPAAGPTAVYKYALLLLLSQRFEDVVVYLHGQERVFVAAHLSALALYNGLLLPLRASAGVSKEVAGTVPLDAILASYTANYIQPVLLNASDRVQRSKIVTIVADYHLILETRWGSQTGALDGVVRERYKAQVDYFMRELILRLLLSLSPGDRDVLLGTLAPSSTSGVLLREHGYLDRFWSPEEMNTFLNRFAVVLQSDYEAYESSCHYLLLAGNYRGSLEVITRQTIRHAQLLFQSLRRSSSSSKAILSTPAMQMSNAAQVCRCVLEWMSFVMHFVETYLKSSSPSNILSSFRAATAAANSSSSSSSTLDGQQLVETVFLTANLGTIFTLVLMDKDYVAAYDLLRSLHLLGLTEMADEVLLVYADCLQALYSVAAVSRVDLRLQEVREEGRRLFHYAQRSRHSLRRSEATLQDLHHTLKALL